MTLTQLLLDVVVVLGVVLMTLLAIVPVWLEAAAQPSPKDSRKTTSPMPSSAMFSMMPLEVKPR